MRSPQSDAYYARGYCCSMDVNLTMPARRFLRGTPCRCQAAST
jgi:hypothetical protein